MNASPAPITRAELAPVVAEVDRLASARQSELGRAEVQAILRELSLPDELLDEALAELARRKEAKRRKRRTLLLGAVAALGVLLATGGSFLALSQRSEARDRVHAEGGRFTIGATDDGGHRPTVARTASPDVYYRVDLRDAPVGQSLALACSWKAPDGTVAHENRYTTKTIDRSVWPTHCHHVLGPAAPAGAWSVEMTLDGRRLTTSELQVE